jgi:hypothetical protein
MPNQEQCRKTQTGKSTKILTLKRHFKITIIDMLFKKLRN